jgi:hypothetical protein
VGTEGELFERFAGGAFGLALAFDAYRDKDDRAEISTSL